MLEHFNLRRAWERLYDDAAAFVNDGGMTWSEFWSTPANRRRRYAEACDRRSARIEAERER